MLNVQDTVRGLPRREPRGMPGMLFRTLKIVQAEFARLLARPGLSAFPILMLVLALSGASQPGAGGLFVVTGVAVSALALALAARYALLALLPPGTASSVGWSHQQSFRAEPEPEHPDTAGRPRSRAPSRVLPAA